MKRNLIWIILMGAILLGDIAVGQEIIIPPSMPGAPSIDRGGVYCYDIRTFELLDCHFTYTLSMGLNDGGHLLHPTPRPIGGLRFPGGDETSLSLSINTRRSVVDVEYLAPEASGGVNLNITATPPEGYKCVFSCFEERRALVEVEGLEQMGQSGTGLWRLTGETTTHADNHYGTLSTIGAMSLIALKYFEETERSLGINDMSLPKGGLFDICGTWNPKGTCSNAPKGGHMEHRTGTDADIDRDEVNCNDDKDLIEAIKFVNAHGHVAGGQPKAKRHCESGGRKHIDFD